MSAVPGIMLYNVVGSIARSGGYAFAAARFDFDENAEGAQGFPFPHPAPLRPLLPELMGSYDHDSDFLCHAWALGRINATFKLLQPKDWDPCRYELFDLPFLAVPDDDPGRTIGWVPFVCVEGYRGPSLIFRVQEDPLNMQRVSEAFWSLLLSRPAELGAFEVVVVDPSEGIWSKWEFLHGRFGWVEPSLDDPYDVAPADAMRWDSHSTWFEGQVRLCDECGGSGEESFYPAGAPCEQCQGLGVIR